MCISKWQWGQGRCRALQGTVAGACWCAIGTSSRQQIRYKHIVAGLHPNLARLGEQYAYIELPCAVRPQPHTPSRLVYCWNNWRHCKRSAKGGFGLAWPFLPGTYKFSVDMLAACCARHAPSPASFKILSFTASPRAQFFILLLSRCLPTVTTPLPLFVPSTDANLCQQRPSSCPR